MNWLDLILLVFLGLSAFFGLRRGLVKTVIPLIGLIIGLMVAGRYYETLADRVFSSQSTTANVAAFVIIVFAFLIAGALIAMIVHKMLSLIMLGWVDHGFGTVIGLAIGALTAGAILSLLLNYSLGVSVIKESAIASFLVDKFPLALSFLPGNFDRARDFFPS